MRDESRTSGTDVRRADEEQRAVRPDGFDRTSGCAENDIDALRKDGLFDKEFYDGDLAWLDFRVPDGLPDASTIVVVAKPKPMLSVTFRWEGRTIPLIVPPAYADGKEVEGEVLAALDRISAPNRYRYVKAKLPLKALAVRSGPRSIW